MKSRGQKRKDDGAKGKKAAQRVHARRRAEERYGVELTGHARKMINSQIQDGKAKFLFRQSGRVTHWMVNFEGKDMFAVYDKKNNQVVTFLPMEEKGNLDAIRCESEGREVDPDQTGIV